MLCDKCHQPVTPTTDAVAIECEMTRNWVGLLINHPRHITCSPSRAQYIVHPEFQPVVDERPEFDKRLMPEAKRHYWEAQWTAAFDGVLIRNMQEA